MDSDLLIKLMHSYKLSYFLFYAAEKGIFDYLSEKTTSEQICADMNFPSEKKMELMLNLFVGIGLLEKEKESYCLHNDYAGLLNSKSKESMIHLLKLEKYLMEHHNSYDNLVFSLEHDAMDDFNDQGKENMEGTYAQAMQNGGGFASLQVGRVFRKIKKAEPRILDVGGGKGNYSVSIVKCCPNVKVDIFERPEMEKICIEKIHSEKMDNSISFHTTDITKEDIPGKYDGILMSNILHLYNRNMLGNMIKKVAESLNTEGILVLHDFFLNESHAEPLVPLLFTIDWLMIGADFNYSPKDMEEIGQSFGLKLIEIKSYKEVPTSILVLRKE